MIIIRRQCDKLDKNEKGHTSTPFTLAVGVINHQKLNTEMSTIVRPNGDFAFFGVNVNQVA